MSYYTEETRKMARELAEACHEAFGLIQTGTGGNVSARIPGEDLMLVKASGGSLGSATEENFLVCDFQGNLVEGTGKPTREAFLHGYIYKVRPDVNAVVHCHSPYAVAWSSTKEALPCCTYHSEMKMGKALPTLDVHAAMVREQDLPMVKGMLDANPGLEGFLLANHGAVAMGKKPMAAEYCAELIEETAQVAVLRRQLGTLAPLDF